MSLTQKTAEPSVHCASAELLRGTSKGGAIHMSRLAQGLQGVEHVHLESLCCACDSRPGPCQASIPLRNPPGLVCAPGSSQAWVTPCPSVLSSSPFDTESFLMSPSPTGKFSMGSRKGSLYNWTPPSTPSFRERYYLVSEPPQGRDAVATRGLRTGAAPWGLVCGAGPSSLAPPEVVSPGLSLPCFGAILGGFWGSSFLSALRSGGLWARFWACLVLLEASRHVLWRVLPPPS